MKKILVTLMIGGVIFGEGKDHSLMNVNGNISLGIKYIDINNNNVSEYPKDFSYLMELFTVGKLDKNEISAILNLDYDKLNRVDISNFYIGFEHPYCNLEGGDVILTGSDFIIKDTTIRGIKGGISNKDALFAFGCSQKKIEPSTTTSGQYRQLLGVINKGFVFRNNRLNITYLQGEDDPSSLDTHEINPIMNRVLGGDLIMPLGRSLSFKSSLAFSEYNPNKTTKETKKEGRAFEGGLSLNFREISFEGIYQYIEPNFYTLGNIGLDTDWKGIKLNVSHTPSDKPITTKLKIERYNDNLDKKGNTTKTEIFNIEEDISLKSFPPFSIDYKRTQERENEAPSKIDNEISFGISYGIKDMDISGNYSKRSSDDKNNNEYDSSISSYSLNLGGALTKKTSLSSSISFTTSKIGNTKQDSHYYLLSFSFQPTPALRLTPSYEHSKTEAEGDVILKNRAISFSCDYFFSTKYKINMEYKNVENKETDNNYKGDLFGVKFTGLF